MAGVVLGGPLAAPALAASIFPPEPIAAPVLGVDPSTRSIGMGGASTAVFWANPNPWANPALIATTQGLRFEHDDADFDFVHIHASRFVLGGGGLGFATSGRPLHILGQLSLDGPNIDFGGGETLSAFERVRSWSIAGSLAGLWSAWARHAGHNSPRLARMGDVAVGYSQNAVEGGFSGDPMEKGVVHDWGVLARVGGAVWKDADARLRLEAATAYAVHNSGRDVIEEVFSFGPPIPAPRQERVGLAARATLDRPWATRLPAWLAEGWHPIVSIGVAYDPVRASAPSNRFDIWGAELGLAGLLFGRLGQRGSGDEAQRSWGLGVALPLGRLGGASYDYARTTNGLIDHVTRNSFSVWLDPLAIWRARRWPSPA
jgi:hypothetical protein